MLQKARVKAFIVFELSRVKQQRGAGGLKLPPPPRLGLIVTFSNQNIRIFSQAQVNQLMVAYQPLLGITFLFVTIK